MEKTTVSLVDFTEIENGHEFEEFANLFLQRLGLQVITKSAIGPDGGRDLICEERNQFGGPGIRWLVSCKHFAKSGRPVGQRDDEANINKLTEFQCHGFIFFYSTPRTQSLANSVERICNIAHVSSQFFGPMEIAQRMIYSPAFYPILLQFFPRSHGVLVGLIETGVACCSGGYAETQFAVYAVYARNPFTYSTRMDLICEACLQNHVNFLDEGGFVLEYVKVREQITY